MHKTRIIFSMFLGNWLAEMISQICQTWYGAEVVNMNKNYRVICYVYWLKKILFKYMVTIFASNLWNSCIRYVSRTGILSWLELSTVFVFHRFTLCLHGYRCRFCKCSVWLFAASSDSHFGKVYIIEFLKVCSLLWYKM